MNYIFKVLYKHIISNLISDFTCVDTVAPSNLSLSVEGAGKAAEKAENNFRYRHLASDISSFAQSSATV